ncbi:hypothetical protein ACP3TB_08065 [Rahnella variigena]|jgi:hypothetical protein|uniref:hypothetical protein n=1 Tax=Rahnella TaxID=34037 RepID=UPI000DD2E02F|nr:MULTISPECIES: hypothetical protein [Rahnella]MDH2898062.1 hypothetical protein [Rahnella variigena]
MNKPCSMSLTLIALIALSACSTKNNVPTIKDTSVNKGTNNTCVNEFKALQRLSPHDFDIYQQQFNQLTKSYDVYKTNKGLINKDAQEILNIELDSKLKLICARVKGATFKSMDERSQEVNKI